MLSLYTWTTPNGRKVPILLEELGLPYELRFVDLSQDEQFAPDFLQLSPNNKIPAIVDDEGESGPLAIFESGAILTYLAERHGRFLAPSGPARWTAIEWLHWQVGGLGPMVGQLNFFAKRASEPVAPAITRFSEEVDRLLGVMDRRLGEAPYLAGADYSIADIACYPWVVAARDMLGDVIGALDERRPAIAAWTTRVGERPAVQKGMAIRS